MAAPPRSWRPTRIPVNPSTASGPDTKAKASGVITVTSARPSNSDGPEIAAPVTAARTGTDPEQAAMAAAARPQPCRASMPSDTSDPDDDSTTTNGSRSASATRAASAMVSPSAWVSAPRWCPETERACTTLRPPMVSTSARTEPRTWVRRATWESE